MSRLNKERRQRFGLCVLRFLSTLDCMQLATSRGYVEEVVGRHAFRSIAASVCLYESCRSRGRARESSSL